MLLESLGNVVIRQWRTICSLHATDAAAAAVACLLAVPSRVVLWSCLALSRPSAARAPPLLYLLLHCAVTGDVRSCLK